MLHFKTDYVKRKLPGCFRCDRGRTGFNEAVLGYEQISRKNRSGNQILRSAEIRGFGRKLTEMVIMGSIMLGTHVISVLLIMGNFEVEKKNNMFI